MFKRASRLWPAVMVLVLVGSLGSCALVLDFISPLPTGEAHPVVVGGTPSAPTFTPDPVTAHRLDFIEWTHPFEETVIIELEGVSVTPKGQVLPSGVTGRVMVLDTASEIQYKYTVKVVPFGEDTIVFDPYIDVEPKRRR